MSILKSLASMTQPAEDKRSAKFSIYDIVEAGKGPVNLKGLSLQYFPESINVDRGVDYAAKHPIGGSHPLYQWIHGSERVLSIDTVFTAEVDLWKPDTSNPFSTVEEIGNKISSFIKNPISSAIASIRPQNYGDNHVDVARGVSWLMSKTYPTYTGSNSVKPPPKLALYMPNSGIQTYINGLPIDDTFYCIMTRCNARYTSFFRSGAPRIAEVSLSFAEIVQVGSQWGFVSRDTFIYNDGAENPKGLPKPKYGYKNLPSNYVPAPSIASADVNNSIPLAEQGNLGKFLP